MEHEEERRAVEERLGTWSMERLVRSGYTLVDLTCGEYVGRQFSRDIVRFRAASLGQNQTFAAGNEAILSRRGPIDSLGKLREDALRVEICDVGPSGLSLSISHADGGKESVMGLPGTWRLDKSSASLAHERTSRNLQAYTSPGAAPSCASPALRRLLMSKPHAASAPRPPATQSPTADKAALQSTRSIGPPAAAQSATERSLLLMTAAAVDDMCAGAADSKLGTAGRLNAPQRAAVVRALVDGSGAHRERPNLTLIQGPPGTGKTSTACALLQMAALGSDAPLLAAADSNTAVDQLLEGLLRRGVNAVRLGRPSRSDPHLLRATVDAAIEAHPEHAALARERATLQAARRRLDALDENESRIARADIRTAWRRLRAREAQLSVEVIAQADVVCATLIGCGGPELGAMRFPLVAIDECSQATEPRCLLALARASSAAVLLGDQKQLAPTCTSRLAAQAGLGQSLFDRMLALHGQHRRDVQHCLLTVQYRMHPLLREWPSATFYNGQLTDGISADERPTPPGFPSASPLAFLDHCGKETSGTPCGTSRLNRSEARAVAVAAAQLLQDDDLQPSDLGIITPYAAQVVAIRRVLGAMGLPTVEVKTVDGFQGREKEVIIVSCVRSNTAGQIGFLEDSRRLNVAITRARRGLLLVGCKRTLATDPTWGSFLAFCAERGEVLRGARGNEAQQHAAPNAWKQREWNGCSNLQ